MFPHANAPSTRRPTAAHAVQVTALCLPGLLRLPEAAIGVVAFAHGSGSGRLSPRNNAVADYLAQAGIGSLLFDLLREEEAVDRRNVFDIGLLARRLLHAIESLLQDPRTRGLPVGLFGASTGAAAALVAAAKAEGRVAAVVSRGGRPDLAFDVLPLVRAPTLLIVGELDSDVLSLNRRALAALRCEKSLQVVPNASHLFEEPGTLAQAAEHAREWFCRYLPVPLAIASET